MLATLAVLVLPTVAAWRQHRYWNEEQWCRQVRQPAWPAAYEKYSALGAWEVKGRTAHSTQWMGHVCASRGARSHCHICEDIACGPSRNLTCAFQYQGTNWSLLARNAPTASDTPFAVGSAVRHRWDFGNADRVCVMMQGGACTAPGTGAVQSQTCAVRCWGASAVGRPQPYDHGWQFSIDRSARPQGFVATVAGDPIARAPGFMDGSASSARFNNPRGLTVDDNGWLYVADSDNHAIRLVFPENSTVLTVAGSGRPGWHDGPLREARFSFPSGVAVYCNATRNASLAAAGAALDPRLQASGHAGCLSPVLIVADTQNHRIRRVVIELAYDGASQTMRVTGGAVDTLAGGANRAEEERELEAHGYSDGFTGDARFHAPLSVAVDGSGNVFVADSRNHAIRHVAPDGYVRTLAGRVKALPYELPGCPWPCRMVSGGTEDGNTTWARFMHPAAIALGPGRPYSLLVADGHRIRMISRSGALPFADGAEVELAGLGHVRNATQSEIASLNIVQTVAGALSPGSEDWLGESARLDTPRGLTLTPDGRVYVTDGSRCRIRRIAVAASAAQPVSCAARLVDVLRPPGCNSHDYALDATGLLHSFVQGAMVLNADPLQFNASRDGKRVRQCVGVPPPDVGYHANGLPVPALGSGGGTGDMPFTQDEDEFTGTVFLLRCPRACSAAPPPAPPLPAPVVVGGGAGNRGLYGDSSSLCAAAVHAGAISDADGGLFLVTVAKGVGPRALPSRRFTLVAAAGVGGSGTSIAAPDSPRTFLISAFSAPLNRTLVSTVAGAPTAPLDSACGFRDGRPPQAAMFDGPVGVAAAPSTHRLTGSQLLYVTDSRNNLIRSLTATCSQICENGGNCTAPDTCTCAPGWGGFDCTIAQCPSGCPARHICSGPSECTCMPGYSGAGCTQAQCVQTCANGGACIAPDTCGCAYGWTDGNCTTPVCAQTCGNGGNCTAPDTCTCPAMWQGADCRTPVCTQRCINNGTCTAPDTCTCPPEWSGHDCSKPVCYQGYFRPDPINRYAPSLWREPFWEQFVPCLREDWCLSTDDFECYQKLRQAYPATLPGNRNITGFRIPQSACFVIELDPLARTPYRYEDENGTTTSYWRYTPQKLYGWGPRADSHPWSSPFPSQSDRMVAIVSWVNMTQGVFVCANGGECVGVNQCRCADGWIGFDCRIPMCRQGFFYPDRVDPRYPGQGSYLVSERTLTVWENPVTPNDKFAGYLHDHPNFHSKLIDMDARLALPTTHQQTDGMGDDTKEGWRRTGWWVRLDLVDWQNGDFPLWYNRTCDSPGKRRDLRSGVIGGLIDSPQDAFQARVSYDDARITSVGRWIEEGGECMDEVLLGCYNKGTCVAPNTCKCAQGWEGHDCSLPVCWQSVADVTNDPVLPITLLRRDGVNVGAIVGPPPALPGDSYVQYRKCPHNGNCTHPNFCTCEKGWAGPSCEVPLCAQECFNGGRCIAPDVCQCVTTPSRYKDKRGLALFAKPDGLPIETGWTGFDCNTPVCTQAERWILNDDTGQYPVRLVATENDGRTFQGGCPGEGRFYPLLRVRLSEELCQIASWYGGNFAEPWANVLFKSFASRGRRVRINHANYIRFDNGTVVQGPPLLGEGMYGCFNKGSCIAPDVCECASGWSGFDCNTPSCVFYDTYSTRVDGCKNSGICTAPNTCACPTQLSLLPTIYPDVLPGAITGWRGPDCSMAICAQGYYDPECIDVPPGPGSVSSMGEGCYRCPNGGNCTAPDTCTCAAGWSGYDCRTPVCELRADVDIVKELNTLDLDRIIAFEVDPCGEKRTAEVRGRQEIIGNCTRPNTCTCLCRERAFKNGEGEYLQKPYKDTLGGQAPAGFIFGRFDCLDGFEGRLNLDGTFASCHLKIYKPTWWDLNKVRVIATVATITTVVIVVLVVLQIIAYRINERRKRAQRRRRAAKAAREKMAAEDAAAAGATAGAGTGGGAGAAAAADASSSKAGSGDGGAAAAAASGPGAGAGTAPGSPAPSAPPARRGSAFVNA